MPSIGKSFLRGLLLGAGEAVNDQPFLPNLAFPFLFQVGARPGKAKQLLAEAGYPDGFKTELLSYSVHYGWLVPKSLPGSCRK